MPLRETEPAVLARTVTVPIANYNDNQHAADENLRMQNLCDRAKNDGCAA
jgi:hypothetical protein